MQAPLHQEEQAPLSHPENQIHEARTGRIAGRVRTLVHPHAVNLHTEIGKKDRLQSATVAAKVETSSAVTDFHRHAVAALRVLENLVSEKILLLALRENRHTESQMTVANAVKADLKNSINLTASEMTRHRIHGADHFQEKDHSIKARGHRIRDSRNAEILIKAKVIRDRGEDHHRMATHLRKGLAELLLSVNLNQAKDRVVATSRTNLSLNETATPTMRRNHALADSINMRAVVKALKGH